MQICAAITALLMILLFAPIAPATAFPGEPSRHAAAHELGAQPFHDAAGTGEECLPHARAHASCCEMACFGCPVVPVGPILPIMVEQTRPSVRHVEVMERLLFGGLERPPKMG